jgi:hypothetical protein
MTTTAAKGNTMQTEMPIVVTWKRVQDYPAGDESYTATLIAVDNMGGAMFRRDEDGFLGHCGAGYWAVDQQAVAAAEYGRLARSV